MNFPDVNLYRNVNRLKEADKVYSEALNLCRTLAKTNPKFYAPNIAMILHKMGKLYKDLNRF